MLPAGVELNAFNCAAFQWKYQYFMSTLSRLITIHSESASHAAKQLNVSDFFVYLNSESEAALLQETVDLGKSQPVVIVVCR